MAPTKDNPTSPKGDQKMGDEDTSTAVTHNQDGVSTVPKDPEKAEAARTKGAEVPKGPASDGGSNG